MNIVFCAEKSAFLSSQAMIEHILRENFKIVHFQIIKNENGKPFLSFSDSAANPLFLSVSHTSQKYFVAFSEQNVGIDAESSSREPNYLPIIAKFPGEEREEILSAKDFLKHWTAKESAVKWLGGSLAHDLKRLSFFRGKLTFSGLDLPVCLTQKEFAGHIVSICHERADDWEFIIL